MHWTHREWPRNAFLLFNSFFSLSSSCLLWGVFRNFSSFQIVWKRCEAMLKHQMTRRYERREAIFCKNSLFIRTFLSRIFVEMRLFISGRGEINSNKLCDSGLMCKYLAEKKHRAEVCEHTAAILAWKTMQGNLFPPQLHTLLFSFVAINSHTSIWSWMNIAALMLPLSKNQTAIYPIIRILSTRQSL